MQTHSVFKITLLALFLLVFAVFTNAQEVDNPMVVKTINAAKTVTVVVVGETAKFTYKATKFTAKNVAKPIVVKSAPAVGKFMLKTSGYAVKKSVPVIRKLAVKYIKYKFIP